MDLQEEEIRALVHGTFLEGAPIVRVSAVTGQGLPELVAALDRIAVGIPGKDASDLFRLPVDRSFSMKGFGTVVTGTVIGGSVATGGGGDPPGRDDREGARAAGPRRSGGAIVRGDPHRGQPAGGREGERPARVGPVPPRDVLSHEVRGGFRRVPAAGP